MKKEGMKKEGKEGLKTERRKDKRLGMNERIKE